MKVAISIPSFYPAIGYGGPIFSSYYSCTELAKLDGITVAVSTTNADVTGTLPVRCQQWLPMMGFAVKYYPLASGRRISWAFAAGIKSDFTHADVVHIQALFNSETVFALWQARRLGKPVCLSPRGALGEWCLAHGQRFGARWLKWGWLQVLIKPLMQNQCWHATSLQERAEILRQFPHATVVIVPNGIELSEFASPPMLSMTAYLQRFAPQWPLFTPARDEPTPKLVVSMGRIQQKKGFDILLQAVALLQQQGWAIRLLIAGQDEGALTALRQLCQQLQLHDNVAFVGALAGADKSAFLANADLFVLPSHNENFGNVYLESLAAGTPIVASRNTPWQEVEAAGCGLWVDNSVAATAEAMATLLAQPLAPLRAQAKRYAARYQWSAIARNLNQMYQSRL
ncbi:MAG: glycosyltransferase [Ferrimonas sp.]